MTTKAQRHPILGFFAGIFFGFGLALILFVFGIVPVTITWLGGLTLGCAVLGIVLAYIAPVRGST